MSYNDLDRANSLNRLVFPTCYPVVDNPSDQLSSFKTVFTRCWDLYPHPRNVISEIYGPLGPNWFLIFGPSPARGYKSSPGPEPVGFGPWISAHP